MNDYFKLVRYDLLYINVFSFDGLNIYENYQNYV